MVKRAHRRSRKYKKKVEPLAVYLRVKKVIFRPVRKFTADYEKDKVLAELLEKHALNRRQRSLAVDAWRELYFIYYATRQRFAEVKP